MYQRLLVPLDGSPPAHQALREAIRFAKEEHAQVRLIHIIGELPDNWADTYFGQETLLADLRRDGQKILASATAFTREQGMQVETAQLEAPDKKTAVIVVEDALRWHADLIVIGTHGHKGLERLLLGSVAEGVVRRAPVPVLLIPSIAEE